MRYSHDQFCDKQNRLFCREITFIFPTVTFYTVVLCIDLIFCINKTARAKAMSVLSPNFWKQKVRKSNKHSTK